MPEGTGHERETAEEVFHEESGEWRTARQGRQAANGPETARQANRDGVSLSADARTQADRGRFPSGSLRSGSATAEPKRPRSPSGRLRTAPTATLPTETGNGETASTASGGRPGRREPATGWELGELIRPLAVRRKARRGSGEIKPFDPPLVEYVYGSRFVIASQLQRRFPEQLPSMRTAQRHAARLVDARLLATAPVRSTGPNFPAVYYATGRGLRLIRESYEEHGQQWEGPQTEAPRQRGLALDSILHELLLSEFDLMIHHTAAARDDVRLLMNERRYFRRDRRLSYRQQGRTRHVVPDAGYLLTMRRGGKFQPLPLFLLEFENGTHTMARVRRKLDAYDAWAEQEGEEYLRSVYEQHGERPEKPNFRLLLVAHDRYGQVSDERRLVDLLVQVLQLPRRMRDRVWLSTAKSLRNCCSPTIWYRARDLRHLSQPQRAGPPRYASSDRANQPTAVSDEISRLSRRTLI